ncbi:hypothetical protein GGI25_006287 [Coemansia spiralis]|uniref:Protein-L-isoaspartate O-methyltransferase n=2 Tax=Coemansia TaxID=4863 RepID=A0A9W8FX64_9FUNG|nr:hypothetical protein GGI26_006346 [Coemansia sp. RSA 1358]KAJ2669035.1 hypothetical protein GGI25_006287 [Coemansia spiralis]
MRSVDRAHFAKNNPYEDAPQYIGYGATISAPHMHGYALEGLRDYLKPGMRVLDVGSGSGYLTACMAAMVGANGRAVGIDHISELVETSKSALSQYYPDWINNNNIHMVIGDGRNGYPPDAPYDCIHVGAASPGEPTTLLSQLKSPGRMFIPVGKYSQQIVVYEKDSNGTVKQKKLMGVAYVPLTNEGDQRDFF